MLFDWLPLLKQQRHVLVAIVNGAHLKAHRHLDGQKVHKLHFVQPDLGQDNQELVIADAVVDNLRSRGLIDSNMKFPAATYLLTDKGAEVARKLAGASTAPLTVHNVR